MHWRADQILLLIVLCLGECKLIITMLLSALSNCMLLIQYREEKNIINVPFLYYSHHLVLCLVEKKWHYSVRDDGVTQEG